MDPRAQLASHLERGLVDAPPGPLAVAFSGGPDSTALLHALAALAPSHRRSLHALHVDHRLHPDSGHWARHCVDFAHSLGLECRVLEVAVDTARGLGPEAAARQARYSALAANLAPGELLVCAHHRDDQAETFLLRALRGSGTEGLAAMRALRPLEPGWLWRPLLDLQRGQILAYNRQQRLECIEDPANALLRHDRNWLRHHLMPLLRQRWPQADASLARCAQLCAEASTLLNAGDGDALALVQEDEPQVIDAGRLQTLAPERQPRVLRLWLEQLQLPPPPASAIQRVLGEVLKAGADRQPRVDWDGARIRRWRHLLHAGTVRPPLPAGLHLTWRNGLPLQLPGGDLLAIEPAAAPGLRIDVRARLGGERILLPGRGHHSTLKTVLQALGVPPWTRERLPLLYAEDGELLAAGDLVVSARMAAILDRRGGRLRWLPAA